jgi:hypothetical protein
VLGDARLVDLDRALPSDFLEDIAPEMGADSLQDMRGTLRRAVRHARMKKKFTGPKVAAEVELPGSGTRRVRRTSRVGASRADPETGGRHP